MNRSRRTFNRTFNINRNSSSDPTHPSTSPTESWTTHDSNLALLECLSIATPTRPALPNELILQILHHPTRWPTLHSVRHPPSVDRDEPIVTVRDQPAGIPIVYTRPFTVREAKLLRKVVFTFRSRDQGWCSEPDSGTWSWFDASLVQLPSTDDEKEGPDHPGDAAVWTGSYNWVRTWMERHDERLRSQPRYKLQENRRADMRPKDHVIELTDEDELVQRVQGGDRIVLWACACFPGWENRVHEAKITAVGVEDLTMEREETNGDAS